MFDRINNGLWWDRAWSLVKGCTPVSPACDHCWLASETHMRASNPNPKIQADNAGLCSGGHFNGAVRLMEKNIDLPLRIKKPTAWAVWSDLFHEGIPFEFIAQAYRTMALADRHVFMILTKRPARMLQFIEWYKKRSLVEGVAGVTFTSAFAHAWHGVTAENQETANERLPLLAQVPAAVRFVSVEPMLGPVNLFDSVPGVFGTLTHPPYAESIHWIVCGGESGKHARPVHPQWVRLLRDECQAAGVPFFFKQWGEWIDFQEATCPDRWHQAWTRRPVHAFEDGTEVIRVGKKDASRSLEGRDYLEQPLPVSMEAARCPG